MSWITQSINHPTRIRLGISINEYVVLDYIYKTQTHPDYGGKYGGWCEEPLSKISIFFGISKSGLSDLMKRMIDKELLEEDGVKRRTTSKWYGSYKDEEVADDRSETERDRSETERNTYIVKDKKRVNDKPTTKKATPKRNGAVSSPPARDEFLGFANPDMAMEIWEEWVQYKKEQHKFTYKSDHSIKLGIAKLLAFSDGSIQKARAIIHDAMANGYKGFFQYEDKMAKSAQVPEQKPQEDNYLLEPEMQSKYERATEWFYKNCHLCQGVRWLSKEEYEKVQNKDSDFIGAMWKYHCVSTEFGKKVQESLLALNRLPRWDKDKWQSVYEWLKKDVSDRIFPRQK